jgi:glucose-6-phosphate isomerase
VKEIKFDFNNMFSESIGSQHGITPADLSVIKACVDKAQQHFSSLLKDSRNRVNLSLEWTQLPYQDRRVLSEINSLAREIKKYENVIFLGIGGSYLGLKAAQDALLAPYYNEFPALRKNKPRAYFEGNNLDPDTLSVLLKNLNPKKTFVVVISKSGETTETKAAFSVVEAWLKKSAGKNYGRQVVAITDPLSGALRKKVNQAQAKDKRSFRSLPLLKGVGGRFSEFNMGLLHLAIMGVDVQEVLDGAAAMAKRCNMADLFRNPSLMYASLHNILYKNKGKPIAVMMPFSETLKSTADWYCQLLAESLGKKYSRRIEVKADGIEEWLKDNSRIVNVGRTPVASRGTNDLHSIQQNNIEGENDKVVTFIRVEQFAGEIKISGEKADILSGKRFSELLNLAQEATEWALVRQSRPNCTIILPEVSPFYWGGLLFFFEMATAFEGELLDINAFDQPGVEGYKNYMYYKLCKPGIAKEITEDIKNNPLVKHSRYII